MPYNFNPSPQPGYGIFGGVPGPVPLPNPAGDLAAQFPGLSRANTLASGDILSELGGRLSPGTINQIQDAAARYGSAGGLPGAPTPGSLSGNLNLESLGLSSEALHRQGIQDYNSLIPTISRTQTVDPSLQATIAAGNAVNAAAPNPMQASSYAQQLFDEYLKKFSRPVGGMRTMGGGGGGGGSRGTGIFDPYTTAGWASDRPNAPAGGAINPPEGFSGHEVNSPDYSGWFSRTFGNQQFGGGTPGTGESNIGPMSDAELNQILAGVDAGTSDLGF